MNSKEKFVSSFPTKEQVIERKVGTWDFTPYFIEKLDGLIEETRKDEVEKIRNIIELSRIQSEMLPTKERDLRDSINNSTTPRFFAYNKALNDLLEVI